MESTKEKGYQITMASVEPAGIIPNLNHSLGTGNSAALSSESSKPHNNQALNDILFFPFLL